MRKLIPPELSFCLQHTFNKRVIFIQILFYNYLKMIIEDYWMILSHFVEILIKLSVSTV